MVPVEDTFNQSLWSAFTHLRRSVEETNRPGNLDGLLASHFDAVGRLGREIIWRVHCDVSNWVEENRSYLDEAPKLAVFGCLLSQQTYSSEGLDAEVRQLFIDYVGRLKHRNANFLSQNAWELQPDVVLGVSLGVKYFHEAPLITWLGEVAQSALNRSQIPYLTRLVYWYVAWLLGLSIKQPDWHSSVNDPSICSLPELALMAYLVRRDIVLVDGQDRNEWLDKAGRILLERLVAYPPYARDDYKAAIIWLAAIQYVEVRAVYPRLDLVSAVLAGFSASMERWRSKWTISDEYDVQALLWLLLRPYFDDLRYEEYLPKLGRSGHRYDIGLPTLGLLVEAKFIRKHADFQKIVDEVGKDAAQLQSQTLFTGFVVFVYDASRSSQNHEWTRRALEQLDKVRRAIIVSAPSVALNEQRDSA